MKHLLQQMIIAVLVTLGCQCIAIADELLLEVNMEEVTSPTRTGPLQIYQPEGRINPFTGSEFSSVNFGLWLTADWDQICTSNIFMSGGHAEGWLLGLFASETSPFFTTQQLQELHSGMRSVFGLSPTSNASALFVTIVGEFDGFTGVGSATRNHCGGSVDAVSVGFLYIFMWPDPEKDGDKGYYVGDLWYWTDISPLGQMYRLYTSNPVL